MAQHTWIHHNYFHNFEPSHRNNSSALHIGHSARSLSPAYALVEYNLFSKTRGENEGAICNKSCDNIYRFNTFAEGCTELSLRHGNRCLVYANFFIGTRGGLRFYSDDHKIYCNYFSRNNPAVQIGNGGANVPPAELTSHDRPDRVHLVFNILVDNRSNIIMRNRRNGLGATDLLVANNIIVGGSSAASIDGPLPGAVWQGNIIWKTAAGDIPADGHSSHDPQLQQEADGVHRLQPGSPAIAAVVGAYPYIDIDSHERSGNLDIGAQQRVAADAMPPQQANLSRVAPAILANRILTANEVGPLAP
jgi:poly(beta-D-mannuronate) lyase